MEASNQIKLVAAVPPSWAEVRPDALGLWKTFGVFAITNTRSGKHYFVASACIGRRLRDNHGWLTNGVHKNRELQRDWDRYQEGFRWYIAQRVSVSWLLPHVKQIWIDEFSPAGLTYNLKRAVPKQQRRRRAIALPKFPLRQLLDQPSRFSTNEDFDRFIDGMVNSIASDRSWAPVTVSELQAHAGRLIKLSKRLVSASGRMSTPSP